MLAVSLSVAPSVLAFVNDGELVWARQAGGTYYDKCRGGIAALPDASVLVTGEFWFSATFGEGESNETALTSDGGTDIFLAKYDSSGALVWAKRAGGSDQQCAGGA